MLISKSVFRGVRTAILAYKNSSTCIKVISLSLCLLFFQAVTGQEDWSTLDAELKARQKILGQDVVMLLWKGDTIAFKKEMGTFNSKTQAPIASCSKWLTAAMIMVLVDEGVLSLDDMISKYIPEFGRYAKRYIPLRACLAHLTGVDDEGKLLKKIFQRKKFSSLEEEVNSYAARDIRESPGKDFWYGSIGPNIAGRVIEVVTKKRFDVVIKQKLFNPLTMRRTSFTTMDGGPVDPAGGALSTPDDYMQFLVMLLNKGKYKGKQILSEKSINELFSIQTKSGMIKYAPDAAQGYNYALGAWVLEEKEGKATALSSPGLFGTWPMIDLCRGYASLIFTKSLLGEQKTEVHRQIKEIIDKEIKAECP